MSEGAAERAVLAARRPSARRAPNTAARASRALRPRRDQLTPTEVESEQGAIHPDGAAAPNPGSVGPADSRRQTQEPGDCAYREESGEAGISPSFSRSPSPGRVLDFSCSPSGRSVPPGADAVFHLAALITILYSYHAPRSYVDTKVIDTLNVLEAVRVCGTPQMVHTFTSEVYGTARTIPTSEAHLPQAQSPTAGTGPICQEAAT